MPFSPSSYILFSPACPLPLVRLHSSAFLGNPSVRRSPFTDQAVLGTFSASQTVPIHTSSNYELLWTRTHNPSRFSMPSRGSQHPGSGHPGSGRRWSFGCVILFLIPPIHPHFHVALFILLLFPMLTRRSRSQLPQPPPPPPPPPMRAVAQGALIVGLGLGLALLVLIEPLLRLTTSPLALASSPVHLEHQQVIARTWKPIWMPIAQLLRRPKVRALPAPIARHHLCFRPRHHHRLSPAPVVLRSNSMFCR